MTETEAARQVDERHLDLVVRRILAPLLARPYSSKSGWGLVGWDAEQGISLFLEGHGRVLLMELDRRDDAKPCFRRTALFNVSVRRHFEDGVPLDEMDAAIADRLVAMIRHQESGVELPERTTTGRRSLVREIEVSRLLVCEGRGHYYVNPYVGCTIGCPFCWAADRADLSRHFEGLPELGWGRWVDVKKNAAEVLRSELSQNAPGPVRFSPVVTDPYQPLEKKHRITRGCIEVMVGTGFVPVILTRAARVVEDAELLSSIPGAAVGLSIPTDDDRVRMAFEPGADPIDERVEALEKLKRAGVRTFAVIQPVLPMNAEALVERLAPLVDAVRVDRLQGFTGMDELLGELGMSKTADEEFSALLIETLLDGFRAYGVAVDELDDLSQLVTVQRDGRGE